MQTTRDTSVASLPPHFSDIKREIAASVPDFETRTTRAWTEIIDELATRTEAIAAEGSNYIPQVAFSDLQTLSAEQLATIKRRGCVLIRGVVNQDEAVSWKRALDEYVVSNPEAKGFPVEDKQFFMLYWTRPQVLARAHPNVLATQKWLNNLYHTDKPLDGVDLSVPLVYADRFRIRKPGVQWDAHPPHIDGGTIERWQSPSFRQCFADILRGEWREHDPYNMATRVNARSDLYDRPNQASVFRTFQGWLALSDTAPTQGTLKLFPDVLLSNAYILLRPFFRLRDGASDVLAAESWEFDLTSPDFPGIIPDRLRGYRGPMPTPAAHPHLALERAMPSVPRVNPGDMVFWHCDLIHAVEREHTGSGDSSVMYIPAVPLTSQNAGYIGRQRDSFLAGAPPPDFPQDDGGERGFIGGGREEDLASEEARRAMGFGLVAASA